MDVVILGCGRVGTALASRLQSRGHRVTVVDQDARAFARLPADFSGRTVTGVGFDRDTLLEAGIESAQAFAAVSSGDNSNIIAARVARETFGVERVVARIYDPRRAEVYERLGIPTVRTVRWTADQVVRLIDPPTDTEEWHDPSGAVVLSELAVPASWIGTPLHALEAAAGLRVAVLERRGEAALPAKGTVLQEHDVVRALYRRDRRDAVLAALTEGPEAAA